MYVIDVSGDGRFSGQSLNEDRDSPRCGGGTVHERGRSARGEMPRPSSTARRVGRGD